MTGFDFTKYLTLPYWSHRKSPAYGEVLHYELDDGYYLLAMGNDAKEGVPRVGKEAYLIICHGEDWVEMYLLRVVEPQHFPLAL